MKPAERRKRIFKIYARNWSLTRPYMALEKHGIAIPPGFETAVICPICMTLFNEAALNQEDLNPLTIEHCPPEELGGKPLILLCKNCNNKAGSSLDIELMRYLNVRPFNESQPQATVNVANTLFKADDLDVKGTMEIRRIDENSFHIDLKANDLYRKQRFDRIISADEITITYRPHKTPPDHLVHTALLKIAYLLAFSKFGHPFIVNPNYDQIRKQISNPLQHILPSKGVIRQTSLPIGFHLIAEPKHMLGIAVVFTVTHGPQIDKNAVILNHPDIQDIAFYEELKDHAETSQIVPQTFNNLDYLNNIDHLTAYMSAIYSISPIRQ